MKALRLKSLSALAGLLLAIPSFAQNITVNGKVTDSETGDPVPGVAVTLENSRTYAITDNSGAYSISVPVSAVHAEACFCCCALSSSSPASWG